MQKSYDSSLTCIELDPERAEKESWRGKATELLGGLEGWRAAMREHLDFGIWVFPPKGSSRGSGFTSQTLSFSAEH